MISYKERKRMNLGRGDLLVIYLRGRKQAREGIVLRVGHIVADPLEDIGKSSEAA